MVTSIESGFIKSTEEKKVKSPEGPEGSFANRTQEVIELFGQKFLKTRIVSQQVSNNSIVSFHLFIWLSLSLLSSWLSLEPSCRLIVVHANDLLQRMKGGCNVDAKWCAIVCIIRLKMPFMTETAVLIGIFHQNSTLTVIIPFSLLKIVVSFSLIHLLNRNTLNEKSWDRFHPKRSKDFRNNSKIDMMICRRVDSIHGSEGRLVLLVSAFIHSSTFWKKRSLSVRLSFLWRDAWFPDFNVLVLIKMIQTSRFPWLPQLIKKTYS